MLKRLRARSKAGSVGRFLEAAHAGNREKVLDFIRKGRDVNVTNEIGVTALHLAAKEGHHNVVQELLKHGARVDATTGKGITALHVACLSGKIEVIRLLLENNAKINIQSKDGFTPLYMAAQENRVEAVRFLLSYGASQSLSTEDGFTALSVALQQGHDDVASVLLGHGTSSKLKLPQMHIATKKGDVRAVGLLLARNKDNVNVTSKSGFTPLHIAAHYGNTDISHLLIGKGASVNFKAKNDISPLHVACKRGRASMVSLLTDNGADVNCQTKDGMTPLHCAAAIGSCKVIGNLLQKEASVKVSTKNGFSALHLAVQGDHVHAAKLLLAHGAPINEVSLEQLTPLHIAAHCGNIRSARLLLEKNCDVNPKAMNGFTPLHIAAKHNHKEIVELLVKYGAKIETKTETGLTPLHVASFMGHSNVVSALLRLGANQDCATSSGDTALHLATRSKNLETIDLLLRSGAQVNSRAADQMTPLHIAVENGDFDSAALLLHHSASPSAKMADLSTPLHLAAAAVGKEDLAQLLLEHGAVHSSANKKGFLPLHLSAKYGNVRMVRLLLSRSDTEPDATCENEITPLHIAVHYNQINAALLLLEKGANPNCQTKNGCTPLHIAASENRMNLVPHLLERGANINAESRAGLTPLHFSSKAGHLMMSSLLLERGASVDHATRDGLTPLHLVAVGNRVPIAESLLQFGANINAENKSGLRPIHLASRCGNAEMVEFLLGRDAETSPAFLNDGESISISTDRLSNDSAVELEGVNSDQLKLPLDSSELPNEVSTSFGISSPDATFQSPTSNLAVSAELDDLNYPDEVSELFAFDLLPDPGSSGRTIQSSPCSQILREFIYIKKDGKDSTTQVPYHPSPLSTDLQPPSTPAVSSAEPTLDPTVHNESSPDEQPCLPDRHRRSSSSALMSHFLICFLVDARGGEMLGCRGSGIRVIVPPDTACMPTRITCRYVRKEKLLRCPPLADGEGLAARVLEMGPEGIAFSGPVLIEVLHFASLQDGKREVIVLRSDNGQKWYEHTAPPADEETLRTLFGTRDESIQKVQIVTEGFPRYFALVSRFRRETTAVGPEGGSLALNAIPEVWAIFPPQSIKRTTRVQLEIHPVADDLVDSICGAEILGCSPVVTIEPRHRRFHQPIALTIPLPKSMICDSDKDIRRSNLRVVSSHSEGTMPAVWEDITDAIALTILNGSATLLVTVSARFWLIDSQKKDFSMSRLSELYRESMIVPFWSKFLVFAKRLHETEAQIRLFSITEDLVDKTSENQDGFTEVARSQDVEVFNGKSINVEVSGNIFPQQNLSPNLCINFHAFRENRLPFTVKILETPEENSVGKLTFAYLTKSESPISSSLQPITIGVLEVKVPDLTDSDKLKVEGKLNQRVSTAEAQISKAELHLTDIADILDADWLPLAMHLGLSAPEISEIQSDYVFVPEQALIMLHHWVLKNGERATGNSLERALKLIGRADVIAACMHNISEVTDDVERSIAKDYISNCGSKDEIACSRLNGPSSSREVSMRRRTFSDVSYGDFSSLPGSRSFCYDTGSEVSSVVGKDEFPKSAFDDQADDHCFYVDGSINSTAYATMRSIESEESDAVLSDDASDVEVGGRYDQKDTWSHPQWKNVVLRRSKDEARVIADASSRLSQVSDVTMTPEDGIESERELTPCVQEVLEVEISNNFSKPGQKSFNGEANLSAGNSPKKPEKDTTTTTTINANGKLSTENPANSEPSVTIYQQSPNEEKTFSLEISSKGNITGLQTASPTDIVNPESVWEVEEGDIYLCTDIRDLEELLDDGTKVKSRMITRKQMRPVEEKLVKGNVVLETRTSEKVIKIEIEEDITMLGPGVSDEFGAHLDCATTTEEFEDVLPDGVPVQKRITKVCVNRKPSNPLVLDWDIDDKATANNPETTVDNLESSESNRDCNEQPLTHPKEEFSVSIMKTTGISASDFNQHQENDPCDVTTASVRKGVIIEKVVGEIFQETEQSSDDELTENGVKINRKIITTRHILPVIGRLKENKDFVVTERFELVGTEIEEEVIESPPEAGGYSEEEEAETSIEESEETLPDGTWLRRKLTYITVKPKQPDILLPLANNLSEIHIDAIILLNSFELKTDKNLSSDINDFNGEDQKPELHLESVSTKNDEGPSSLYSDGSIKDVDKTSLVAVEPNIHMALTCDSQGNGAIVHTDFRNSAVIRTELDPNEICANETREKTNHTTVFDNGFSLAIEISEKVDTIDHDTDITETGKKGLPADNAFENAVGKKTTLLSQQSNQNVDEQEFAYTDGNRIPVNKEVFNDEAAGFHESLSQKAALDADISRQQIDHKLFLDSNQARMNDAQRVSGDEVPVKEFTVETRISAEEPQTEVDVNILMGDDSCKKVPKGTVPLVADAAAKKGDNINNFEKMEGAVTSVEALGSAVDPDAKAIVDAKKTSLDMFGSSVDPELKFLTDAKRAEYDNQQDQDDTDHLLATVNLNSHNTVNNSEFFILSEEIPVIETNLNLTPDVDVQQKNSIKLDVDLEVERHLVPATPQETEMPAKVDQSSISVVSPETGVFEQFIQTPVDANETQKTGPSINLSKNSSNVDIISKDIKETDAEKYARVKEGADLEERHELPQDSKKEMCHAQSPQEFDILSDHVVFEQHSDIKKESTSYISEKLIDSKIVEMLNSENTKQLVLVPNESQVTCVGNPVENSQLYLPAGEVTLPYNTDHLQSVRFQYMPSEASSFVELQKPNSVYIGDDNTEKVHLFETKISSKSVRHDSSCDENERKPLETSESQKELNGVLSNPAALKNDFAVPVVHDESHEFNKDAYDIAQTEVDIPQKQHTSCLVESNGIEGSVSHYWNQGSGELFGKSGSISLSELASGSDLKKNSHVEWVANADMSAFDNPSRDNDNVKEQSTEYVSEESFFEDPSLMVHLPTDQSDSLFRSSELGNTDAFSEESLITNNMNAELSKILAKYGVSSKKRRSEPSHCNEESAITYPFSDQYTPGELEQHSFHSGATHSPVEGDGFAGNESQRIVETNAGNEPLSGHLSTFEQLKTLAQRDFKSKNPEIAAEGEVTRLKDPLATEYSGSPNLTYTEDLHKDSQRGGDISDDHEKPSATTPRSKRINYNRPERRLIRPSNSQDSLADDMHSPGYPFVPYEENFNSRILPAASVRERILSPVSRDSPFPSLLDEDDVFSSPRSRDVFPQTLLEPSSSAVPTLPLEHDIQPFTLSMNNLRNNISTRKDILADTFSEVHTTDTGTVPDKPSTARNFPLEHEATFPSLSGKRQFSSRTGSVERDNPSPVSAASVRRSIPPRSRIRRSSHDAAQTSLTSPTASSAENVFLAPRNDSNTLPRRPVDLCLYPKKEFKDDLHEFSTATLQQDLLSPDATFCMSPVEGLPISRQPSILQSTLEAHSRYLDAVAKIDEIAPGLLSPTLMGPDVTQETVKGKIRCSTSEHDDKNIETGDRTIMKKSTIIRYFQPVVHNFYRNGVLIESKNSEVILGKYIDDFTYDTPTNINSFSELNGETSTSVDVSEETLPDGTWLKHKTTRVLVGSSEDRKQNKKQLIDKGMNSETNFSRNSQTHHPLLEPGVLQADKHLSGGQVPTFRQDFGVAKSGVEAGIDAVKFPKDSLPPKGSASRDFSSLFAEMQERASSATGDRKASLEAVLRKLGGLTGSLDTKQIDESKLHSSQPSPPSGVQAWGDINSEMFQETPSLNTTSVVNDTNVVSSTSQEEQMQFPSQLTDTVTLCEQLPTEENLHLAKSEELVKMESPMQTDELPSEVHSPQLESKFKELDAKEDQNTEHSNTYPGISEILNAEAISLSNFATSVSSDEITDKTNTPLQNIPEVEIKFVKTTVKKSVKKKVKTANDDNNAVEEVTSAPLPEQNSDTELPDPVLMSDTIETDLHPDCQYSHSEVLAEKEDEFHSSAFEHMRLPETSTERDGKDFPCNGSSGGLNSTEHTGNDSFVVDTAKINTATEEGDQSEALLAQRAQLVE